MTPMRAELTAAALLAASAAEDAALLPRIKAALERRHVADPEVWNGYPCSAAEDGESDYYGGLFLNLERCTRVDPSRLMAKAIRIAFELGQASIVGTTDPEKTERILTGMEKLDNARKGGGDTTGSYTKRDADGGHKALKKLWAERHEQVSDHELAREACADKCITKLGEDRARALFGQWRREAVYANERDTWATGDWIAMKEYPGGGREHRRRTHDGYHVVLTEDDGRWRCLVQLHDYEEEDRIWEWKGGSAESLDEAKAESYAVVKEVREQLAQAKKRLAKRRAKRTGKIASRAARLPISTSRHKSRR